MTQNVSSQRGLVGVGCGRSTVQNGKSRFETIDGGEKWGTLTVIDLKAKGKIL